MAAIRLPFPSSRRSSQSTATRRTPNRRRQPGRTIPVLTIPPPSLTVVPAKDGVNQFFAGYEPPPAPIVELSDFAAPSATLPRLTANATAPAPFPFGELPSLVSSPAGARFAPQPTPVSLASPGDDADPSNPGGGSGFITNGGPGGDGPSAPGGESPGPTVVTITATDPNAAEEGPDPGEFTVSRQGDTSADLTVYYQVSGTARADADYEPLSGVMTIAAGATQAAITLTPFDDNWAEGDESVIVTLLPDYSYEVGVPDTGTVTIHDDATDTGPVVIIGASDPIAAEAGPDPGGFTVYRSGDLAQTLTVFYWATGSAKEGKDYESLPGQVTIAAGAADASIVVSPLDDNWAEGDETVIITLLPDYPYDLGDPDDGSLLIGDDPTDSGPVVTVVPTDPDAAETGPDPGAFTFYRTGDPSAELLVPYSVVGPATPGEDYLTLPGSVTFPGGGSSVTIEIIPIDDDYSEGSESIVVIIEDEPEYDLGDPSYGPVIIDPDPTDTIPVVSITATDPEASEEGPDPGEFTISRTADTSGPLTVYYMVSPASTATFDVDYTGLPSMNGNVVIQAGYEYVTLPITPIPDWEEEGYETVVVGLMPAPDGSYALGSPVSDTVYIEDHPLAPEALDDYYTLTQGQTLTVPPPGILENDSDPDGNTLTAQLDDLPDHGTLTNFDGAGGFEYAPDGGFVGPDTFSYRAWNGVLHSNVATVFLSVNAAGETTVQIINQTRKNDRVVSAKAEAYGIPGGTKELEVVVAPATETATLTIKRTSGTWGSAVFQSTGTSTMQVTGRQKIVIVGDEQSDLPRNMQIEAKIGDQVKATWEFTVFYVQIDAFLEGRARDLIPATAKNPAETPLIDVYNRRTRNIGLLDHQHIAEQFAYGGIYLRGKIFPYGMDPRDFNPDHSRTLSFNWDRRLSARLYKNGGLFQDLPEAAADDRSDDRRDDDEDLTADRDGTPNHLFIHVFDAPGLGADPRSVDGDVYRLRGNFVEHAQYAGVKVSQAVRWFWRSSHENPAGARRFSQKDDVEGDNFLGLGTTPLTPDLGASTLPSFTVTSIAPNMVRVGQGRIAVTITGTNLNADPVSRPVAYLTREVPGTTSLSGALISIALGTPSAETASGAVLIGSDADPGVYDLKFFIADKAQTVKNAFTIVP